MRGSAILKSQIENINLRWEIIMKTANNRNQLLETVLERAFQDEHKKIISWIRNRYQEVLDFDSTSDDRKLQRFIQVSNMRTRIS